MSQQNKVSQLVIIVTRVKSLICQYESFIAECEYEIDKLYTQGENGDYVDREWIVSLEQAKESHEQAIRALEWVLAGGERPV